MSIGCMTFGLKKQNIFPVAILVKESAFKKEYIEKFYVTPLVTMGVSKEDIIAFPLKYNAADKTPVAFIKEYWESLKKILEGFSVKHVLVNDAAYFKTVCRLRKAEPFYGYPQSVPISSSYNLTLALGINYQSIFYNPTISNKLEMGLQTIAKSYLGDTPLFQNDLYANTRLLEDIKEIADAIENLYNYPAVTIDIETTGLHLKDTAIMSIAFAINEKQGFAFANSCTFQNHPWNNILEGALVKIFLLTYPGKLIFHNASFDTKFLIRHLWMKHPKDLENALIGLECLYRNLEDTKLLTYLATNTTAGNSLGLKDQAFEFTGNYALDDLTNLNNIPMEDILRYNVTDALATWYVYNKYRQIVKETQEQVYQEVFLPVLKAITFQEIVGIPYSYKRALQLNKELHEKSHILMDQLVQSDPVKEVEEILKLNAMLEANSKLKFKKKELADFDSLTFNPQSNKQLRILLYDILGLPVISNTDTGLASTDGDTLNKLITHVKQQINS